MPGRPGSVPVALVAARLCGAARLVSSREVRERSVTAERVRDRRHALPSRSRTAVPARTAWLDVAVLGTIAVIAGLFYYAWHAPVLDPSGRPDPWFYLGFFVNFDFLFGHYGFTYYASRLPWIIVGRILYAIFPPLIAFFVMHAAFFLGGSLAAYFLFRRYYDRTVAVVAFAALVTNTVYFVAHGNDYVDGPVITLLLVAVLLAVPRGIGRRAHLSLGGSGFAVAAALGMNLAAGPFALGLVFVWASVRLGARDWKRRALKDAAAFLAGAIVLVVLVGLYSKSAGGPAFFMRQQIDALGQLQGDTYRIPGWIWLLRTPKVFVIPALLVLLALVRPRRPWTIADRLVLGSAAYGVYLVVLGAYWEARQGAVLEYPFYFSLFTPGTILVLAALLQRLRATDLARGRSVAVAVAAVVVAALPNLVVYVNGPSPFMLSRRGGLVVLGFGVVAAAAILARRIGRFRVAASAVAAAAAVSGANLAAAASITTSPDLIRSDRGAFTDRLQDMRVSLEFIRFMKRNHLEDTPFAFWVQDYGPRRAIISTYLYMWPTAGRNLPRIDAELRKRLVYFHPYHLILLCPASCEAAARALTQAGDRTSKGTSATIASGSDVVHVQVVTFPANRVRGPYDKYAQFYANGPSKLVSAPVGRTIHRWDLQRGSPAGWTGEAADDLDAAHGAPFATGSRQWEYEIQSTHLRLEPGTYAAYLRGKVVFGGLDLGVLDTDRNRWVEQSLYWFRQRGFSRGWMSVRFRLVQATPVQLVLSNWIPSDQSSRWALDELRLVRVGS
jgi:hypothetical protein